MPAFTMELWRAIEYSGGVVTRPNGIAVINGGNIGLNHYPIFDPSHREVLNGKIVDHYWNNEIGHETFHMWRLAMQAKMNEIMGPMNQLYLSELIEFDPLATINLKNISSGATDQEGRIDQRGTNSATTKTEATGENKARGINSAFPQTMLAGNEDYASTGADQKSWSNQESNGEQEGETTSATDNTAKTTSKAETTTQGFTGPAAALLMQYREAIINVDSMVIEQLQPLFMQVWDTGNTYFGGQTNGGLFPYAY